eukprot:scaffold303356_cov30-Tisochrysis_lutea.AAC.3
MNLRAARTPRALHAIHRRECHRTRRLALGEPAARCEPRRKGCAPSRRRAARAPVGTRATRPAQRAGGLRKAAPPRHRRSRRSCAPPPRLRARAGLMRSIW